MNSTFQIFRSCLYRQVKTTFLSQSQFGKGIRTSSNLAFKRNCKLLKHQNSEEINAKCNKCLRRDKTVPLITMTRTFASTPVRWSESGQNGDNATKDFLNQDQHLQEGKPVYASEMPPDMRFKRGILPLEQIYQHVVDENGRDIVVMQLDKSVNYVEYFVIVTANSSRHLAHMAETLNILYKDVKSESDPFTLIEGKKSCKDWQCIDFGNVVVHFMLEEVRERYQLEKLWMLGPKYDDQFLATPSVEDIINQVSDKEIFLLSDENEDSVSFVDGADIVNPWEIAYDEKEAGRDSSRKIWDEDEDAYII